MTRVAAAALTTLALGLVFVPLVRALARRVGMVAAPRKDRWHSQPTALLGGVGIFAAFAIGVAVFPEAADDAGPVLLASAFLFVVGLVDDVLHIRPLLKLGLQVIAAAMVVGAGLHLPWTHQPIVDGAITMIWLVGITNAVNLLDNMDGLSAGISAIACVFLSLTFMLNGQAELAVLPALVCGAALGFLAYNFKPASIFMGDGGSMFLGSLLGGLALLSSYGRSRSVASVVLTPVLIMAIPILDTSFVTITRRLRGQPVSQGGRDHTSHRLVALGASERRAVWILYLLAAVAGSVAVAVRGMETAQLLVVIPSFAIVLCLFAAYLNSLTGHGSVAKRVVRFRHAWLLMVLLDVILAGVAYLLSYGLRWDWEVPPQQRAVLAQTVAPVIAVEIAGFALGGLYRRGWRSVRVEDLLVLVQCVALGAVLAAAMVLRSYGFQGPSRGIFLLNAGVLMIVVPASRLFPHLLRAAIVGRSKDGARTPILVYGRYPELVIEALRENPAHRCEPVGVIDTSEDHAGQTFVNGVPVFSLGQLSTVRTRFAVNDVVVLEKGDDDGVVHVIRNLGFSCRRLSLHLESA
jgi:UDP-GlcNAc:undecaprenyl-phosphate GlcNAc-1-phosphate transferase